MKITSFSGRRAVDIREYYEKDDEWLPGKKVRGDDVWSFV